MLDERDDNAGILAMLRRVCAKTEKKNVKVEGLLDGNTKKQQYDALEAL